MVLFKIKRTAREPIDLPFSIAILFLLPLAAFTINLLQSVIADERMRVSTAL